MKTKKNSRNIILEKINRILQRKREQNTLLPISEVDMNLNVFGTTIENKIQFFTDELRKVNGEVIICENEAQFICDLENLFHIEGWKSTYCLDESLQQFLAKAKLKFEDQKSEFRDMEIGFTTCEFGVARTGSLLVSSKMISGRQMNVYPPIHLVLLKFSQLVNELEEAYQAIYDKYAPDVPSMITLITGPSRTADIEKTLVIGAHGPKRLIVFLCQV